MHGAYSCELTTALTEEIADYVAYITRRQESQRSSLIQALRITLLGNLFAVLYSECLHWLRVCGLIRW